MQKVNGWPVGDHNRPPINHGKPWSDDHVELAERKLREGWSVKMVADTISRQPSAVISKLEKLCVIQSHDYGTTYLFTEHKCIRGAQNKSDKETQQTEEETIMTNHVFETKTFIDGKDVATYSAESLLTMADKISTRMSKLGGLTKAYIDANGGNVAACAKVAASLQVEYDKCKENLVKVVDLAAEKLNAANSTAE